MTAVRAFCIDNYMITFVMVTYVTCLSFHSSIILQLTQPKEVDSLLQ